MVVSMRPDGSRRDRPGGIRLADTRATRQGLHEEAGPGRRLSKPNGGRRGQPGPIGHGRKASRSGVSARMDSTNELEYRPTEPPPVRPGQADEGALVWGCTIEGTPPPIVPRQGPPLSESTVAV